MSHNQIENRIPSKECPTNPSISKVDVFDIDHKSFKTGLSQAYYEQLMRHDWHGKVRNRVRQRGWGW